MTPTSSITTPINESQITISGPSKKTVTPPINDIWMVIFGFLSRRDCTVLSLTNRFFRKIGSHSSILARFIPSYIANTHNKNIRALSTDEQYRRGQEIEKNLCEGTAFTAIGCLQLPNLSSSVESSKGHHYFVTEHYLVANYSPERFSDSEKHGHIYVLDLKTKVAKFFQTHLRGIETVEWSDPFLITGTPYNLTYANESRGRTLAIWNLKEIMKQEGNRKVEGDEKQQAEQLEIEATPCFHYNGIGVTSALSFFNFRIN